MCNATDRGRFEVNAGSSDSSSRSSECFQEVGNKEGMVKTLAKPMLHYRLLNCRASGLLEQSDEPKCSVCCFSLSMFPPRTGLSFAFVGSSVICFDGTIANNPIDRPSIDHPPQALFKRSTTSLSRTIVSLPRQGL
jgi:hypothetical protein